MVRGLIGAMQLAYEILVSRATDGAVLNGVYEKAYPDLGLQYRFRNANNHQLIFGRLTLGADGTVGLDGAP